jgi:hypothetical protein
MKKTLIMLLIVVAIIMMYLGIKASMLPPVFTGIGFIIIAVLFAKKD